MRDFDNIRLPKSSTNEEQETLSRKKFESLFDEKRFILKGEVIDNGIDYRCEIKYDSRKLGFGFNFQLKSKGAADKNTDESYSKSIETSNIEYLINNGQPAFYGFYLADNDNFYYEHLNDFLISIQEKNPDWEDQLSHTLRFHKQLDSRAVDEIYNIALEHGKMMRGLNGRLAMLPSLAQPSDKIIIGLNQRVIDDSEIRNIVERVGFELINEGRWKDIIHVHQEASGNIGTTAKYNLVLGMANYYSGNLLSALSFFKHARLNSNQLPDYLIKYLTFFDTTVKYTLGMMRQEGYEQVIQTLEGDDELGLYVKLEKVREAYTQSVILFEQFVRELKRIISHPNAFGSVSQMAKCELLLHEGYEMNIDYVQGVAAINSHERHNDLSLEDRLVVANQMADARILWDKQIQELIQETTNSKNYFTYHSTLLNQVRVRYQFDVYSALVRVDKQIPNHPSQPLPDSQQRYEAMLAVLEKVLSYFTQIRHTENMIMVLSTKYELEHYLDRMEEASNTMAELEQLIAQSDSEGLRLQVSMLKDAGTTHEKFKDFIDSIFGKAQAEEEEFQAMVHEMKCMDAEERAIAKSFDNIYGIMLFPIGFFQFPASEVDDVFTILNIQDAALRSTFCEMFSRGIMPVANIYHNPISEEGYADGHASEQGLKSTKHFYNIRKAFYIRKYYRIESANEQ
ncbi:DUF4365 domain-containing protein [Pontibacter qinzhouensis]|nr:DUF4365 domain-containing protein [Pontibacter qinzhouensis]